MSNPKLDQRVHLPTKNVHWKHRPLGLVSAFKAEGPMDSPWLETGSSALRPTNKIWMRFLQSSVATKGERPLWTPVRHLWSMVGINVFLVSVQA